MKNIQMCLVKFNSFDRGIKAEILKEGTKKTKIRLLEPFLTYLQGEIVRVWNRMIISIE